MAKKIKRNWDSVCLDYLIKASTTSMGPLSATFDPDIDFRVKISFEIGEIVSKLNKYQLEKMDKIIKEQESMISNN